MSDLVGDVMTRDVHVVGPEANFREMVRLMLDHHVHALPVVDPKRAVIGMVAESDLLWKEEYTEGRLWMPLQHHGRACLSGTTAGEVMSRPVVTVTPEKSLGHAARLLHRRRVGRLPVVEDGRLLGIVTRSDLLRCFLSSDEDLVAAVREAIARCGGPAAETISVTADNGIVALAGSARFVSEVMGIADAVRHVPGIVRLDVKATAMYDDVHASLVGP